MEKWRGLVLLVIALSLVGVIILTWGSIGSAALTLCLLLMGASLLYQHFLINSEDNDFNMD